MGDLTQTKVQGHQDIFQDEQILERVGRLGETKEKDGIPQLSVSSDDNSIIELSTIWSTFRQHLDSNRIRNEPKVLETILRYTAWIIFDGRFTQKVAPSTKSQLVEAFRSVGSIKDASSSSVGRICASLVPLSESPWTESVFKAATSEESPKEAVDELWVREGRVLLETRVETLGRMKRLPTIDLIARILRICANKGNVWGTDVHVTSSQDPSQFDAFNYRNLEEYCDLLETAVLFWKHTDIHFLATLPVHVIVKTLRRLTSPRASPPRLLPRLWVKKDPRQLVREFSNSFLPALLRTQADSYSLTAFFDFWVDVNVESTPPEERLSHVKALVDKESFDSLFSTSYLYSLAFFLRQKFGANKTTRELFATLFVRALVVDINCIEKYRTEVPLDPQKVRNSCEGLAARILQLSQFFEFDGHPKTSRDLLLTSFSLKPSQDLFDQLFPTTEPPHTPSPQEDLELPEDLCNDLLTVVFRPRWAALGRQIKGDEQKRYCKELLEKDFSWLCTGRQNSELKYVNVNYDDYKHLPSKYDPDDDGIEKGFTLSGKRMKNMKRSRVNQGPRQAQQKLIKNYKSLRDSVKIRGKPGRKFKSPEVEGKLKTVTQYLRQTQTITKFLEVTESCHPKSTISSRARKLKQQYKIAYCKQEKIIPGHVNVVPFPNAYKCRTGGIYLDSIRVKPTGYIATSTPFHMRLHRAGNFDLEFRVSKSILGKKIMDTHQPRLQKQPDDKQNLEYSPHAEKSSLTKRKGVTMLKKIKELESCPLKQLTQQYNKLKENHSQFSNDSNEHFDAACPSALEFIIPIPIYGESDPTQSPGSPELNNNMEQDCQEGAIPKLAGFHIGDMIEFKNRKRIIRLPHGPKHLLESAKLRIMLNDATDRIQSNIDHETYKYPSVQSELRATKGLPLLLPNLNKEAPSDNIKRKRPTALAAKSTGSSIHQAYAPQKIDVTQLQNIVDSADFQLKSGEIPNEFIDSRERRKPIKLGFSSSVVQIAAGAFEEKLHRFGKLHSRRNPVLC